MHVKGGKLSSTYLTENRKNIVALSDVVNILYLVILAHQKIKSWSDLDHPGYAPLRSMPYSHHIKMSFSEILPNRISELIFDENKLNAAKGFWEVGLKDLVKELPDFDRVIDGLRRELRGL